MRRKFAHVYHGASLGGQRATTGSVHSGAYATCPRSRSLDGLEAKWGEWWEAAGTYRFDRTKTREQIYCDRHAAADGERLAARRPRRYRYTHTDLMARYQRMRGARCSIRSGGTTTVCRPSAACRTTSACGATRRCRTTRRFDAAGATGRSSRFRSRGRNFIELCERLTRRGREGVRGAVPHARPVGRLALLYTTIGERARRVVAARRSCGCCGRGSPTRPRRRRCGTSTSEPPSRRPRSRTARSPALTTASRSTARTAAGTSRSRRRGRS